MKRNVLLPILFIVILSISGCAMTAKAAYKTFVEEVCSVTEDQVYYMYLRQNGEEYFVLHDEQGRRISGIRSADGNMRLYQENKQYYYVLDKDASWAAVSSCDSEAVHSGIKQKILDALLQDSQNIEKYKKFRIGWFEYELPLFRNSEESQILELYSNMDKHTGEYRLAYAFREPDHLLYEDNISYWPGLEEESADDGMLIVVNAVRWADENLLYGWGELTIPNENDHPRPPKSGDLKNI